jgi:regulation of enolase protein 1 (concanavalin A-like superfamily)
MGWSSQDIGSVGFAGAFTKFGEQNLTVRASGADIWGTIDGFRFTSLPVTGNGGVMIRETLGATSKNVFVGLQGATQATFQARTATGGSTTNVKRAGAAPLWVKLGRAGDVFSAYTSPDGVAWSQLGVPVTIPMAASAYAGLALTSHTNATSAIAAFSNVKVTSVSTLPSPWITANIGSVGVSGEASMVGGVLTASGSGADIWGTADAFRYVYFPTVGNAQLTAQLTSLQNTNAWAKAGVMIRATESAGSSNGYMALTPSNGAVFQTRSASGAVTTSVKAAGAVPKWVRITRVGNSISGFVSDNGTAWTLVGTGSVPMSGTILVGVAVTSHNNTSAAKVVVQGLNPN